VWLPLVCTLDVGTWTPDRSLFERGERRKEHMQAGCFGSAERVPTRRHVYIACPAVLGLARIAHPPHPHHSHQGSDGRTLFAQVDLRERLSTLEEVEDPSSTALNGMYGMDASHTRVLRATGSASTLLTPEGVRRMLEVGSVAAGSNDAKGWRFEIRAIHRQVGPRDELSSPFLSPSCTQPALTRQPVLRHTASPPRYSSCVFEGRRNKSWAQNRVSIQVAPP